MKKRGLGLGCLGLGLLVMGCKHPIKVDQRPLPERQLSVSLRTFQAKNAGAWLVAEGEPLHNGDFIYFTLRASQQTYLYVVLFGSDGSPKTLFPTAQYQLAPGRCAIRIPANRTLNLSEPAGIEDLRVVASLRPLAEVDRSLCEELRLDCSAPAQGSQPVVAPCAAEQPPEQATRGEVRGVKISLADNNGIAQTRFALRHDP